MSEVKRGEQQGVPFCTLVPHVDDILPQLPADMTSLPPLILHSHCMGSMHLHMQRGSQVSRRESP